MFKFHQKSLSNVKKDCNYGLEFQPKVLSDDHMFGGKNVGGEGDEEEEIKVN